MVSFTKILGGTAILGVASATTLHANKGCVIANNNKLCAGSGGVLVSGQTRILACINNDGLKTFASCEFNGNIPENWGDAYFGADNCVYGSGKKPVLVGCASPISPTAVPNPY